MDVPEGNAISAAEFAARELSDGEFSEVEDISFVVSMLSRAARQFKCWAIGVANRELIVQNPEARKMKLN
jgi:hypothetical protein